MTLELVPWRGANVPVLARDEISRYNIQDYLNWIQYSQNYMGTPAPVTTYGNRPAEPISSSFEGFVWGMLYAAGPVAAVEAYRLRVFGQAPLLYQDFVDGRGGDFFDDPVLERLREPWTSGNLSDLMKRSLVYGDFGGNAFVLDLEDELVLVRPDWVEIVLEKRMHRGGQVGWRQRGIVYYEGGLNVGDGVPFLPGEYCHFVPGLPDPLATYRGMSWLTPLVREVQADKAASDHKVAFFENAASPNLAVSLPKELTTKQFNDFVEAMDAKHKGVQNVGKTLYTGGGADVTVIGANMQQMDFSSVQGKGETRVANAGGVPPTLLSFSEGMQGSSLNAGNYTAAKRNFVDTTMRDLWQNFASSIQKMDAFRPPKEKSRLWYVGRDIPFMHEDAKDLAEIQQTQASTVNSYITAGFKPDTAVTAVERDDLKLLEHTGLTSVQLMPPGSQDTDGDGIPDAEAEAGEDYEAALDEFRSELAWHDEILRKFNPDQLRDQRGRWSLTGAVIDALKAQGGEQDGMYLPGGRYVDWSAYDEDDVDQPYTFEVGVADDAVQIPMNDADMERLYNALSVSRLRDSGDATTPTLVALAALGESDAINFDDGYIDWSKGESGAYHFYAESNEGEGTVEFDLSPAEMDQLIASLALSTQTRESVRSYIERRDYYDVRDFRGRFRKISDRVGHALNEWLKGDGDADDPLEEFSRENLRLAAKEFGITPRRGASSDELKLALLKDARARFRGDSDAKDAEAPPSHRLTLQSKAYRDQDVGVYQERNGKVSLYRESSSGQRGSKVVTVASLAELEQWGRDNGEPQVAEWAASERGAAKPTKRAPAKKAAPRKAPAKKATGPAAAKDLVPLPASARPLSEDELVALQLLSAKGWFSTARQEGGWVDADQVTFMHRRHLEALAEKGWIQKHVGPEGVSYRIDPRSAGAQKAAKDAADNPDAALVGDIEPRREEPESRLSLSQIHLGAILQVHRDPNNASLFDRESSDGSRPMRIKVQRIEHVDENGERTNAVLTPYRRIIGHDTETGRRVQSGPVPGGSYWSWVANPDSDVPADIEGEIVPDRKGVAAPPPKAAPRKAAKSVPARQTAELRRAFNVEINGLTARVNPGLSKTYVDGEGRTVHRIEGEIRDSDGKIVGSFRRLLYPETGTVHNDSFGIAKEHQQRGFFTRFNDRAEAMLVEQGYTRATVNASLAGGYANARRYDNWDSTAGRPPNGDVPDHIVEQMGRTDDPELLAQMRGWLDAFRSGDRATWPSPREIADSPMGRDILANSHWQGERQLGSGDLVERIGAATSEDQVRTILTDSPLTIAELKELAPKVAPSAPMHGTRQQLIDNIAAGSAASLTHRPAGVFADPAKSVPAKATPKPKREPLGDPAAKLASLRALGDVEAVRDDLDLHTVAELKILAGEVGVATSGRKRDVVDRIAAKIDSTPVSTPLSDKDIDTRSERLRDTGTDQTAIKELLADLDDGQLRQMAAAWLVDLPESGGRDDLSSRLAVGIADYNRRQVPSNAAPTVPPRNPWNGPPSTRGGNRLDGADPAYEAAPDDAQFDAPDTEVRKAVEEAWFAMTGGAPGAWASLEDVRTRIGDRYPFKQVNRVLRHLNRERDADLLPELYGGDVTDPERDARVNIGGKGYHEVGFDGEQAARIRREQQGVGSAQVRDPAVDAIVDQVQAAGGGEGRTARVTRLLLDAGLNGEQLRQVASRLRLDVPDSVKSKRFLQAFIANNAPDPEQSARDRQASLDTARTAVEALVDLDTMAHNGGSEKALRQRVDTRVRMGALTEDEGARLRAALDGSSAKLARDLQPGDLVPSLDVADDEPRLVTGLSKAAGGDVVVHYKDPRRTAWDKTGAIRLSGDTEVDLASDGDASDPATRFRTAVADILSSRGATTHHSVGDVVPFDPSTMRAQGDRPDRGTPVQVVSPGATLVEDDGTVVTLAPTVVMDAGGVGPKGESPGPRVDALRTRIAELGDEARPIAEEIAKRLESTRVHTHDEEQAYYRRLDRLRELNAEGATAARDLLRALSERDGEPWGGDPDTDADRWQPVAPGFGTFENQHTLDPDEFQKLRDRYVITDSTTIRNNASLRSGSPTPAAESWARRMSRMVRSSRLAHDTRLHRGAALTPEQIVALRPGTVIRDRGIVSTDERPDGSGGADFYANTRVERNPGTIKTLFEIRAPQGSSAISVGHSEVVLDRDQNFRVVSSRQDADGTVHVVMELIP